MWRRTSADWSVTEGHDAGTCPRRRERRTSVRFDWTHVDVLRRDHVTGLVEELDLDRERPSGVGVVHHVAAERRLIRGWSEFGERDLGRQRHRVVLERR